MLITTTDGATAAARAGSAVDGILLFLVNSKFTLAAATTQCKNEMQHRATFDVVFLGSLVIVHLLSCTPALLLKAGQ